MSDDAPSPLLADASDVGGPPLTPDAVENIIDDFRRWSREHVEQAESILARPPRAPLDTVAVVAQFTALRQEVNLQTKNSRGQLEQNAQTLEQLARALQAVREQQQRLRESDVAAQDEQQRPLIKAMVDTRDALALAARKIAQLRESLSLPEPIALPELPASVSASVAPSASLTPPWWARMLGLGPWLRAAAQNSASPVLPSTLKAWADEQQDRITRNHEQNVAFLQAIESILTGYSMSLDRLDRVLEDLGVIAIECVGEPFDAETMEVVEVIRDSGRLTTEVLEEVRPGYRWRDVLFRCAQVRVARP